MHNTLIKEQAHTLVEKMPDNSTWDDLMHEIYVRSVIEQGMQDSASGRTMDVQEVRAKYGLPK
ncbi:MAG: hypothetical protein PHO37_09910 [Kiritimatiellae bacterium]|nr:hypothetical protein [Kiritimatiellia bacterium]